VVVGGGLTHRAILPPKERGGNLFGGEEAGHGFLRGDGKLCQPLVAGGRRLPAGDNRRDPIGFLLLVAQPEPKTGCDAAHFFVSQTCQVFT
jgi:hypothetical protein